MQMLVPGEEKEIAALQRKTAQNPGIFHPLSHYNLLCLIKAFLLPEPSNMERFPSLKSTYVSWVFGRECGSQIPVT
jgi:hypothetical protein